MSLEEAKRIDSYWIPRGMWLEFGTIGRVGPWRWKELWLDRRENHELQVPQIPPT